MQDVIKISNEQTLKSGIKDLVVAALDAKGTAHLKNCVLTDDRLNRVEFQITVTIHKAKDHLGNEVVLNNCVPEKRAHFAKDLDKLVSGDYVLVSKTPTPEMERAAMEAGAGFLFAKIWAEALKASQKVRPASVVAACMRVTDL